MVQTSKRLQREVIERGHKHDQRQRLCIECTREGDTVQQIHLNIKEQCALGRDGDATMCAPHSSEPLSAH
jgi:hypothetical protein